MTPPIFNASLQCLICKKDSGTLTRLHPTVPVIVQARAGEADGGDCSLLAGSTGAQVVATLRRVVGKVPSPES